ncbi:YhdH/YhfP family quinone oxidoreductase [Desulfotignum phosphitoxidans]|uniref:Putative quinone oxidoreductase YhfP n=1 Tax=Desulfotignum phosphitoxidans DSM 13687 TaxID=1286635 RepID=S0G296_9BACT|nr:YhdH/YhfP family quinone oxidoreductase [Desulfotignum phosphitoxidans]EMS78267.1 putative quinone oxidoreductase YhfP [Desulfotignum phosphitoxidans DSM 13687]
MTDQTFDAFIVKEIADKQYAGRVEQTRVRDLPEGEVLIRVKYSSLNYKDALSATGNKGVTRTYPHTPGIDAAGHVEESRVPVLAPGDPVIVTSYDLGMNTAGGFGQYIRVPADWVVPLPGGLTLAESMILGTAGFTAAMSVEKIFDIPVDAGPILVTGATGGVGSLAVAILSKLKYEVTAVSGKKETGFLKTLGASEIIDRRAFVQNNGAPILKPRWAGVIDTVGGDILATAIKSARAWGKVTCCGLVASSDLPITVFPFILRGVSLFGIDSQHYPIAPRQALWKKLAHDWKPDNLKDMATHITLHQLPTAIDNMLNGRLKGRTVVNLG